MELTYHLFAFDELSLDQLYDLMRLRQEVFVVEQDCPYLDADDKDQESFHVLGVNKDGVLYAYTRLVPKGVSYEEYTSIGRVVNSKEVRGLGVGTELMVQSMESARKLWPGIPIKISAQSHLEQFYNRLGFISTGDTYLEDGIPHKAMITQF